MTEATQPWPGFKYEPVRGLADRRISRYLRTQRKNMRRFFAERGLFDELEQMERIRKSRQGMMAKNRMFQEVLDAYAKRTTPPPGPEAPPVESAERVLVLPSGETGSERSGPAVAGDDRVDGSRLDAEGGIQRVATEDSGSGLVIEE